MKRFNIIAAVFFAACIFFSCSDFLDREPDSIFTEEEVYSDENMIKSVLANYYSRINWGQNFDREGEEYGALDEACFSKGEPDNSTGFADTIWRVYDYELIRNINQFLKGLQSEYTEHLETDFTKRMEAEARFIRAWTYFNMAKGMGGVPIVYDEIFDDRAGADVLEMQVARSTESETYDYIISECTEVAEMLTEDPASLTNPPIISEDPAKNTNGARANKWVALSLKARAALYAASLAKYNNLVTPEIVTAGREVGIPAEKANAYYKLAMETAEEIINSGYYALYEKNPDKSKNFYLLFASKSDNPEIIWTLDYVYPGKVNNFTSKCLPTVLSYSGTANRVVPLLNLVEAFEYKNDRNGELKIKNNSGEYIYYDNPGDLFKDKDPRLHGTVICPGDNFRGTEITYQAGQKYYQRGAWRTRIASPGTKDGDGDWITHSNGPAETSAWFDNKTGFNFAKFIDESESAADPGRGSEIPFIRFRLAEMYLIVSEAALELGDETKALTFINKIRNRAGISELTSMTLDDIVQERRVEFALENHRWWDLKRWRKAHVVWNGVDGDPGATQYVLFPYYIKSSGNEHDKKWVFEKQKSYGTTNARNFKLQNYYNVFDQGWLNNNPKLVKNPLQ